MPLDRSPLAGHLQDGSTRLGAAEALLHTDPTRAAELARSLLGQADDQVAPHALMLIARAAYQQGQLADALPGLARAREIFIRRGDLRQTFEAALMLGRIHRDCGNFDDATEALGKALDLSRQLNEPAAEVDVLNLQGTVLSSQGEYQRALTRLEGALELAHMHGLRVSQAHILGNLGTLHTSLANYPEALGHLLEAHEIFRTVSTDLRSRAANLISLGQLYQELGKLGDARSFFAQARRVGQEAHDLLIEGVSLNNLAGLDMQAEDWTSALASFKAALDITKRIGASQYELDNLDGLGQVYVALGNFRQGLETHEAALVLARKLGDREGETDALLNLGRDYLAMGQPLRATQPLSEAVALAQRAQRLRSVFAAHELLAQAYEQAGDFARALHHHRAFHHAEKTVFNEENERKTRFLTVQFEVERMRYEAEESRLRSEVMKRARDEAENTIRERTLELEEAQLEIATRLAIAAEYHDDNTGDHTRRVGRTAAAIAYALGWPEDEVLQLFIAARLHDVGKIGVGDVILHKPAKLTTHEMTSMQQHTVIGAKILANGNSRLLKTAEEIALYHHERWDARGYPYGLSGEFIPLTARIVAVADVLDALIHERPYKHAWSIDEALAEVRRQSRRHFDPRVVDVCTQIFSPDTGFSLTYAAPDWQRTLLDLQQRVPRRV